MTKTNLIIRKNGGKTEKGCLFFDAIHTTNKSNEEVKKKLLCVVYGNTLRCGYDDDDDGWCLYIVTTASRHIRFPNTHDPV